MLNYPNKVQAFAALAVAIEPITRGKVEGDRELRALWILEGYALSLGFPDAEPEGPAALKPENMAAAEFSAAVKTFRRRDLAEQLRAASASPLVDILLGLPWAEILTLIRELINAARQSKPAPQTPTLPPSSPAPPAAPPTPAGWPE